MNIRAIIGQRINEQRKIKHLTQAALAEKAGNLGQSRVNNWEKGVRTPGLDEIKKLAAILEVAPAYLMGLTDRKTPYPFDEPNGEQLAPVLDYQQARQAGLWLENIQKRQGIERISYIAIAQEYRPANAQLFVIKVKDKSMEPEFLLDDYLIVDIKILPQPGDSVLVALDNLPEIIIRKYKQLSVLKNLERVEFSPANADWASVQLSQETASIVGVVIAFMRKIKAY